MATVFSVVIVVLVLIVAVLAYFDFVKGDQ